MVRLDFIVLKYYIEGEKIVWNIEITGEIISKTISEIIGETINEVILKVKMIRELVTLKKNLKVGEN